MGAALISAPESALETCELEGMRVTTQAFATTDVESSVGGDGVPVDENAGMI